MAKPLSVCVHVRIRSTAPVERIEPMRNAIVGAVVAIADLYAVRVKRRQVTRAQLSQLLRAYRKRHREQPGGQPPPRRVHSGARR
jgi:hypothetical protein